MKDLVRTSMNFEKLGPNSILGVFHLKSNRDVILDIGDREGRVERGLSQGGWCFDHGKRKEGGDGLGRKTKNRDLGRSGRRKKKETLF